MNGAELFARYAYPPNQRGYCGPGDPDGLLAHDSPEAVAEIARRARQFEGAWVYLELIAEAAGISDPLDARVVEAYWIGNELLDAVDSEWFGSRLRERFRGQPTGQWSGGIPETLGDVSPHHAFHVFAIYPWVALLSRGNDIPRSVLDSCRIRVGRVTEIRGDRAFVLVNPLTWDGVVLGLGAPQQTDVRWSESGRSLAPDVRAGDLVALHWDWICDRLSERQAAELRLREAQQHESTNRAFRTR